MHYPLLSSIWVHNQMGQMFALLHQKHLKIFLMAVYVDNLCVFFFGLLMSSFIAREVVSNTQAFQSFC